MSVLDMTAHLQEVFTIEPITEWRSKLHLVNVPSTHEGFCALFASGFSLLFKEEVAEVVVRIIFKIMG